MAFFILFITSLSSILFFNNSYLFGFVFLLLSIFLNLKEKNKKIIILSLLFFILFFALSFIYKIILFKSSYFIVLERKEKYLILFNGLNKFYCKIDQSLKIDFLDIIKLTGDYNKYNFVTLESDFNFNEYLFSKGIDYQINYKELELVFSFPINPFFIKQSFLSSIENEGVRNLISSILFSINNYESEEYSKILNLQIISLFSATGIYLNMLLYGLKKLFKFKFKDNVSSILALITLSPFLFLNLNKLSTIRVIAFYIFNLINKYILNSKYEKIEEISLIGIGFLFINPRVIFQSSFYISFLIIITFNFLSNKLNNFKKIEKKFISQLLIVCLLIPINLNFNNQFNVLTLPLYLIISPFCKLFFLVSFLTLFVIPINWGEFILNIMSKVIFFFDELKINTYAPKFNSWLIIIYYSMLFLIVWFFEINYKKKVRIYSSIFISFLFLYFLPIKNSFTYQISFINVGQGDSTLIRIKNEAYLIDTGGLVYKDVAQNVLIPYLRSNRIYKLNAVFITHYDYDHYGALELLNKNFIIDDCYDYSNFNSFNSHSFKLTNLNANYDINGDENDKSLVLKLDIKNETYIFMGDASKQVEKEILKEYPLLKCDVLKVGHHGSNTSSSLEFLIALNPKEAVISCGLNNIYNHPSEETIANLKKLNIKTRRTDLEGTITYKKLIF